MKKSTKVKFYTQKKVIDGVEYTAQFNGLNSYLRSLDNSHSDAGTYLSMERMANYFLKNVIVDPKVTADDFDDYDVLSEVISFAREVASGTFREEQKVEVLVGEAREADVGLLEAGSGSGD